MTGVSRGKLGGVTLVLSSALALAIVPGYATGVTAQTAAPTPSAQPTVQQPAGTIPFNPITLADLGPLSTNITGVMWLDVNGDNVGFAYGQNGCGHCGPYVTRLDVENVPAMKRVEIKTSINPDDLYSGGFMGAINMHFEGTKLVWDQPGTTPTPPAYNSTVAGDYACEHCYYDITTGQGGLYVGPSDRPETPTPAPDWDASIIPGRYNGLNGGTQDPDTIKVVRRSTGQVVINKQLPQYQHAGMLHVALDKLVFVQTAFGPDGSYASPSLVQVVWLLDPNPAFTSAWAKADGPVAAGKAARSWLWGPAPDAIAKEAYQQGPGGAHLVQYYDKSRMEVNNPNADPASPYYVTNGLLVTEMVSGQIQIGDAETITASVACTIPVAGDPRKDNPLTPGYSALAGVASLHGDHQAQDRTGQQVSESMDVSGAVSLDTTHSGVAKYASFVPQTGHNIPDLFMSYLSGMKGAYGFDWTFVLGYPITEAYWTRMRVGGQDHAVLIQAFQRRVLTYTPDFAPEWRVQQGNVGRHYYEWRYFLNKFQPFSTPF